MSVRVRVCLAEDLRPGDRRSAIMGRDDKGIPFQAIIFRDQDGTLRAYRNLCQHLPVPLDAGSKNYLSPDRQHIVCKTHGATYRLSDGYCISGPCEGKNLIGLDIEEEDGEIYVSRPD